MRAPALPLALAAALCAGAARAEVRVIPFGAARYMESCGGCHGLTGVSAKREIPQLRDAVGRFACTEEGRAYIVRLPNVAFAHMDDDALAQAVNYMVFSLGGTSTPPSTRRYTAAEVAALRRQPMKATDLVSRRAEVLGRALAACAARG